MAIERRPRNVGLVELGLGGPAEFPELKLGLAVRWRSTPGGVRKAMRHGRVKGVVVECESPNVDSAALVANFVARESERMPVWIAMSSNRTLLLAKVVSVVRVDGNGRVDVEVLTPRELEVLGLIRLGMTNHGISDRLGISMSTVKRHVEHVLAKLAVRNRTQAAGRLRRQDS